MNPRALLHEQLIDDYLAAWNARDAGAQARHLAASWSPAGRFEDPQACLYGRAAMEAYIVGFRAANVDATLLLTGAVGHLRRHFHFAWALLGERGEPFLAGCAFAEVGAEGLIRRLDSFFGRQALARGDLIAAATIRKAQGATPIPERQRGA